MVFVFGTTERPRPRGLVVDRCPNCLDLEWFELIDHHRTFHAYFIPLGRGRYLYTSRRCTECGAAFPLEREDYVTTIAEQDRGVLDLREGLRRTNPTLSKRFDAIDELEKAAGEPYRAPDDESGREKLARALEQLRQLERRGVDAGRWIGRLANWSRLSAAERDLLCAELKGFYEATTG